MPTIGSRSISSLPRVKVDPSDLNALLAIAALFVNASADSILRSGRMQEVHARQAIALVLFERGHAIGAIGQALGRDHSTIIHALKRVHGLRLTDTYIEDLIRALRAAPIVPPRRAELEWSMTEVGDLLEQLDAQIEAVEMLRVNITEALLGRIDNTLLRARRARDVLAHDLVVVRGARPLRSLP